MMAMRRWAPTAALRSAATRCSSSPTMRTCSRSTGPPGGWSGKRPWPGGRQHYGGTVAPLVVKDTVIAGVAGGKKESADSSPLPRRDRRARLAPLDRSPPRRARDRDVAGKRTGHRAAARRGSRAPTTRRPTPFIGRPAIPVPIPTMRDRGGDNLYTNCVLALERQDRRAEMALPVHAPRCRGPGCDRTERAGRYALSGTPRSSCCTPTATASSTCSIARTGRCCWRNRFCAAWIGRRASERTAGR